MDLRASLFPNASPAFFGSRLSALSSGWRVIAAPRSGDVFRRGYGQHTRSCPDAIADLHPQFQRRSQQDIDARAEFDQTDALPALQRVTHALPEYDTAREEASDLPHHDRACGALQGEDILLILDRGALAAGNSEPALLIDHVAHRSRNGRAIDVHIDRRHEDADAARGPTCETFFGNLDHAAVRGGNNRGGVCGRSAFGIAEKIEDEEGENQKQNSRLIQAERKRPACDQSERQSVPIAFFDHKGGYLPSSRSRHAHVSGPRCDRQRSAVLLDYAVPVLWTSVSIWSLSLSFNFLSRVSSICSCSLRYLLE